MKRLLAMPLALILCLPLAGCPSANSPTPPAALAPGYFNANDQRMGETLSAAHAFYTRIHDDAAAGKVTLTPTEKTAFNALATSLNIAQPMYKAYHAGTATEVQAQTAINDVQTKQLSVQSMGVN